MFMAKVCQCYDIKQPRNNWTLHICFAVLNWEITNSHLILNTHNVYFLQLDYKITLLLFLRKRQSYPGLWLCNEHYPPFHPISSHTLSGVDVARSRRTSGGIPPPLTISRWFGKFSFVNAMIAIPAMYWSFSDFNINISTKMLIPIISAICCCCRRVSPASAQSALAPRCSCARINKLH